MNKQDFFDKINAALIEQDRNGTKKAVEEALANEVTPMEILNKGLSSALQELGVLFAEEEVFLPELLLAADITTEIMNDLKGRFVSDEMKVEKRGKALIATVEGDVHEIGKSLVGMIMGASGYEVIDAGKDVKNSKLVELVKEHHPDVVGLSSLLTSTMNSQREFVEMAKEAGIRDQIKIIVGGAPVSRDWAEKIGADGYAEDASSAVLECNKLLGLKF